MLVLYNELILFVIITKFKYLSGNVVEIAR